MRSSLFLLLSHIDWLILRIKETENAYAVIAMLNVLLITSSSLLAVYASLLSDIFLCFQPPTGVVSPFVQTGNRNDRVAEFQSQDEVSGFMGVEKLFLRTHSV